MRLADLPPEALALILDNLSQSVIELWKSGDSTLRSLMKRGGVSSLDLNHEAFDSPVRWPRCLKEFRLRSLSVECVHALCTTSTLRKELRSLHSDIKELALSFPDASKALFGLTGPKTLEAIDSDEESTQPPSKRSKHAEDSDDKAALHDYACNWDLVWPKLERLRLASRAEYYHDSGLQLSPLHAFACLPRSLLHLELETQTFATPFTDFSTLPPYLQTLKLLPDILTESDLPLLPKTITDLGNSVDEASLVLFAEDPNLLPNLADIPLPSGMEAGDGLPSLSERVYDDRDLQWPERLQHLSILEYSSEQIFSKDTPLPTNLKTLTIALSSSTFDLTRNYLETTFPKHLTKLRVNRMCLDDGIESSMWPKTLTILELNDDNFGPYAFHKLPRTLTELNLDCMEDRDEEYRPLPPFKISEALEHGVRMIKAEEAALWETLKTQLIKQGDQFPSGNASEYIEYVESGHLFGLPLTLRTMRVCVFAYRHECVLTLPPQVQDLEIESSKTTRTPAFWSRLPPSLVDVIMDRAQIGDMETLDHWDALFTSDPKDCALYRSKFIQSFEYSTSRDDVWRCCKYLPRSLLTLIFSAYKSKRLVEIGKFDLPPNLTRLEVNVQSTSYKNLVDILPATLTWLNVSSARIPGRTLSQLPPRLIHLRCEFEEVTLEHLLAMPKTLIKIVFLGYSTSAKTDKTNGFLKAKHIRTLIEAFTPWRCIFEAPMDVVMYELDMNVSANNDVKPFGSSDSQDGDEESGQETSLHSLDEGLGDEEDEEDEAEISLLEEEEEEEEILDIDPRTIRRIRGL